MISQIVINKKKMSYRFDIRVVVQSKDELLKLLSHPTRLEFLTSLAIKSKYRHLKINPNYPTDDEGIPTSTAGGQGNQGDIECFEDENVINSVKKKVNNLMQDLPIFKS